MKGLAVSAALFLWVQAAPGSPPAPGVREEPNAAEAFADLEWISRDAACKASSSATHAGLVYYPVRALLTGEDPNAEVPGRRTVAFHTEEEEDPYIIITLKEAGVLEGLFIENLRFDPHVPGYDIMFERAAKMAVWASSDGNSWEMVWRAQRAQKCWAIRLENPLVAQHVKIGLLGRDYLHLTAVRVYGPSNGLPFLTRRPEADQILRRDGTAILGVIEDKAYVLTGALGKVEIPVDRTAGVVPEPNEPGRARIVQADEQVLAGNLRGPSVRVRLTDGSVLEIPWGEVRQVGRRISKDKPQRPGASEPYILLRSGDRLAWTGLAQKMRLATGWGEIELPPKSIAALEAADANGETHRVRLHGGSVLTGVLSPRSLTVSLRTFPPLPIDAVDIRRLASPSGTRSPAAPFTLRMKKGDLLVGQMASEVVSVRTGSGLIRVPLASLRTMSADVGRPGIVRGTMWDDTALAGFLVDSNLGVRLLADGAVTSIQTADLASITNASPLPPPEILKRIDSLVAALGAPAYGDREAAQEALIALGRSILPLLEPHRGSDDLEVRTRIENIIRRLTPGERSAP